MGGCVNKTDNVITLRLKENVFIPQSDNNLKLKKPLVKAISMDVLSQKIKKINHPFKKESNNISRIVNLPEIKNNENDINNFNSLREIVELFDCKYEKQKM